MADQRKKLIVNRELQLREAAGSAAIVIISINLLLILGTVSPDLIRISVNLPTTGYMLVALVELVLLAAVVALSIRHSHRIAGPVYAIARDLTHAVTSGTGRIGVIPAFRAGQTPNFALYL